MLETKKDMVRITDSLMVQIEEHTLSTDKKLRLLDKFVAMDGNSFSQEAMSELKKMTYRIKDF